MAPMSGTDVFAWRPAASGTCPAALSVAGEHYPCQTMEMMDEGSEGHDGWAHSNREAEAIWTDDVHSIGGE